MQMDIALFAPITAYGFHIVDLIEQKKLEKKNWNLEIFLIVDWPDKKDQLITVIGNYHSAKRAFFKEIIKYHHY